MASVEHVYVRTTPPGPQDADSSSPREPRKQPSDTFDYTGCLIGVLIMVYYNPH